MAPDIDLNGISQRRNPENVYRYTFGDAHVHDSAFHSTRTVQLSHGDGIAHLGLSQRFRSSCPPFIRILF